MNAPQYLFLGIIAAYWLIHFILFSRQAIEFEKRKLVKEASGYHNLDNFIQVKNNEFVGFRENFKFLLEIAAIALFGLKITGLLELLGFVILGLIFIPGILFYTKLVKIHAIFLNELYILRDHQSKSKPK